MRYNRVKILKKSRLGRRASSHVMRREQEQCVEVLLKFECKWTTVREGQRIDKRLRLERQRCAHYLKLHSIQLSTHVYMYLLNEKKCLLIL